MSRRTKAEIMEGLESISPRIVDYNTVEYYRPDKTRVIRLHLTDILEFFPDGSILLNSGGWQTVTTKDRMNKFLPQRWTVYSHKSQWYLYKYNPDPEKYSGPWEPFQDGMTFNPETGEVFGGMSEEDLQEVETKRKAINAFANKIRNMESLPEPGSGDCWICSMFQGTDCLMSHVEEGYIHGSLILRAMRSRGREDIGIGWLTGWGSKNVASHRPFDIPAQDVRRFIMKAEGIPV